MIAKQARRRSNKSMKRMQHATDSWLDAVKDFSADAGRSAVRGLDHLRENAGEYLDEGIHYAVDAERSVVKYVRKYPIRSLLFAAGATLLCGMFFTQSSDD